MALANRYYACRHAESTANVSGIIVSDPAHGVRQEYGLSPRGREQAIAVRLSVWFLLPQHIINPQQASTSLLDLTGASIEDIVVLSSDFSRALETASLLTEPHDIFVEPDDRLRYEVVA